MKCTQFIGQLVSLDLYAYGPVSIVDDVLTTGASMEEARWKFSEDVLGVVIFARGRCPSWVKPIFQLADWAEL